LTGRALASYASAMSEEFAANAYSEFREYPAWSVVDRAVNDLIENQDLEETTVHELIVGYIVKSLVEAGNEGGNKYSYYLQDLGTELRQMADEALREARSASTGEREFHEGLLSTYSTVLSLMQQQADTFEIPYSDLNLDGLDPDNDLLVASERPTPKKTRRGYWNVRLGRLHLLLFAYREPREHESPDE